MKKLASVLALCVFAFAGSCTAEELNLGPWKAAYSTDGLTALSFEDVVWLRQGSFTVFKPGYKEHWFDMTGAAVAAETKPDGARITWTKKAGDQLDATLELALAQDSATWRGRFRVGVEGPVEMGILAPSALLETPNGVIHCTVRGQEMEFYREKVFAGFGPGAPIRFDSPEWTATFDCASSARAWRVQDKRADAGAPVRFIACLTASGKEPLEAEASLTLRSKRYAPAEAAGRKALLSQCMREYKEMPVQNAGFEAAATPEGWTFGATASIVEADAAQGKRCLKISVQSPQERSVYATQKVPVQAGSRYGLTGMVKAENVKPAAVLDMSSVGDALILEWADKDGKWLASGAYSNEGSFGSHGWERRQCREVIAPPGAHFAIIFLGLRGLGTAWFDDVRLVECRPAVVLLSPLSGSKLGDNRPLFTWKPDPDAEGYRIEISQDPAMAKEKVRVSEALAESRFRPEKPLPPGTWYWRVSRNDGFPSSIWSFDQTSPEDADTTGPGLSFDYASFEKADQPLAVRVSDPSGVKPQGVKVQVDDRPVDAAIEQAGDVVRVLPQGGWQRGAHRVSISATDEKGNASADSCWIAVAPPPPQKIAWTRDRGVLIGDQHRLLLGIYQVTEKDMPRVKSAGFDFVHNYQWEGDQDDTAARAYLDAAQRNGLMAFVGFDRGGSSKSGLCQLNLEHVTKRIAALRDHPALLAWYLFDEPDLSHQYISPRNLKLLYDHIHRLDPYHPVIVTFAVGDSPSKYPRCYDVYWTMVYSTTARLDEKMRRDRAAIGDAPLMAICHSYDQKQAAALKAGEPVDGAKFQPDLRLMRANAFTSLADGSSSMCWWWYGNGGKTFLSVGDVPQAWGWLTQVVRELHELEPVLTADGKQVQLSVSPPDAPLRVWGRLVGRKLTIIAVNPSEKELSAELSADGLPPAGEAAVRFEDRKAPVKDGKLADSFAPLQPHIYEIEAP